MIREMVKIDEKLCNGCGLCIPNCHEGALQIIDGKARLISDLMCDGLGACIGHCPQGAMTIEKREAEAYDEVKVMRENIVKAGPNVIKAHLLHLKEHNQTEYLNQGIQYLKDNNLSVPDLSGEEPKAHKGCPGSRELSFDKKKTTEETGSVSSQLTQWPVQFHLINPLAPYFKDSDLLIAADCTAFAVGDFHSKWLKDKSVAIGCPKLDNNIERYKEKVIRLIDEANVNTITVMIMEVPCCSGLMQLAVQAVNEAKRKVPLKKVIVSISGDILSTEWL